MLVGEIQRQYFHREKAPGHTGGLGQQGTCKGKKKDGEW